MPPKVQQSNAKHYKSNTDHRGQGVRGPSAPHARPGGLGGGRRLRAGVGQQPRRAAEPGRVTAAGAARGFDAIVIGAGPAGQHCAGHLADGGLRVALVERELVGGECDYWACIPSKTLLRPGEALQAAREAPGAARGRDRRLDPRARSNGATSWSPTTTTRPRPPSSRRRASTCCAARRGSPARAGWRSDGERYSAEHVVIATGSDPVIPPDPRPARAGRRVDEPRGHRADRGAAATAGARRRAGRRGDGPGREPHGRVGRARRGHGPRARARADAARRGARRGAERGGNRALLRRSTPRRPAATTTSTCSSSPSATSFAATGCWWPPAGVPRVDGLGLDTVGIEPTRQGIAVDARMNAADGVWAIGDVTGIWPLTYVGKYQGRVAAANILGTRTGGQLRRRSARGLHRPAGRLRGRGRGRGHGHRPAGRGAPHLHLHARLCREPGFMTLVSDGERLTGAYALGPEAGEWLQQATVAIRARVPLSVHERHDPAVPDLLRGVPQRSRISRPVRRPEHDQRSDDGR